MTTECTEALREQLRAVHEDPEDFRQTFAEWKAGGAATEYTYYLFGKDGGYGMLPFQMSTGSLKHVHLVPLLDPVALAKWDRAHDREQRKVSNRVLVYAEDSRGNHLLIYVLDEPDAHEIAKMKTPGHKQLMRQLTTVAETWAFTGKIEA